MTEQPDPLLREIQQLLAKITQGPWAWEPTAEKSNDFAVGTAWREDGSPIEGRIPEGEWVEDAIIRGKCIGMNESGHANYADAEFIAAAPRLLRACLARLEAQQGALKQADAYFDRLRRLTTNREVWNLANEDTTAETHISVKLALVAPAGAERQEEP